MALGVSAVGNTKHGSFTPKTGRQTVLQSRKEGGSGGYTSHFPDVDVYVASACGYNYGKAGLKGRLSGADNDVSYHRVHTYEGRA